MSRHSQYPSLMDRTVSIASDYTPYNEYEEESEEEYDAYGGEMFASGEEDYYKQEGYGAYGSDRFVSGEEDYYKQEGYGAYGGERFVSGEENYYQEEEYGAYGGERFVSGEEDYYQEEEYDAYGGERFVSGEDYYKYYESESDGEFSDTDAEYGSHSSDKQEDSRYTYTSQRRRQDQRRTRRAGGKPEYSPLVVAAIDFGTTYSGWAFSFKHDFERDPLKVSAKQWIGGQLVSLKGPTCVLIEPDKKTVAAFGYEAEDKFIDLMTEKKHQNYYYFHRFKMMLHKKVGLQRDAKLKDITGKQLPAKRVFTLCIKYLVDDMKKMCDRQIADESLSYDDIQWVLTVPAIWTDVAKQFMREAAQNAGIARDKLSIALEPEAASVYCRHIPVEKGNQSSLSSFKAGTKYLVLDAGGGTVDVTVHQISGDGSLKELHKASGDAWGGTLVDEAFEAFLVELFGKRIMDIFKTKYLEDHMEIFRDFEVKKRNVKPSGEGLVTIRLPASLRELIKSEHGEDPGTIVARSKYRGQISAIQDKLRIQAGVIVRLFDGPVCSIVEHVSKLLRKHEVRDCRAILMVGGFSESPILQERLREAFERKKIKIIIPPDAGLGVLKGAVIYGHKPEAITERVCRYTYGTAQWDDTFDIHARVDQKIKVGEESPEIIRYPHNPTGKTVVFPIFLSSSDNPKKSTEPGCKEIGSLEVPNPDPRPAAPKENRQLGVTFLFGGTEIEVKVVAKKTGRVDRTYIDFLQ